MDNFGNQKRPPTDDQSAATQIERPTEDVAAPDSIDADAIDERLRQKIAQQSAIATFGQMALEGAGVDDLAEEAVRLISGNLPAEGAAVFELLADGKHLLRRARIGPKAQLDPPGTPLGADSLPLAFSALEAMSPTVIEDLDHSSFGTSELVLYHAVNSSINVPIPGALRPYGVMAAYGIGGRRFTTADIDFMRGMANIYAQAINRSRVEGELRLSREYFRSLIENISNVIGVMDQDGAVLFVSKSVKAVLGRDPDRLVGVKIFSYHDPAYLERLQQAHQEALRNLHRPVRVETRIRHENGSWVDCEIVLQSTTSLAGRPVIVSTLRDITERKRMERERSLLALIVESSDDAIISRDLEGRVTSWNPGAERLYGYKASEMLGKQREIFEAPEQVAQMRAHFETVIRTRRPLRLEAKRRRKDGSLVEVSATISPLLGPDGGILGTAAISRDITERQLAERARELARSNAELEEFAYVASHDLKEPLRVMGGYAQLLKQRLAGKVDAETTRFLTYIENAARRGLALNDALLTYARLAPETRALTLVDCDAVVTEVMRDLQPALESVSATVTREPLPRVMADRALLVQLFENLIANAIKFKGRQPLTIHIGAERQPFQWQFAVRDNGIGVDPHYHERIFEMFQRLHRTDEYPGTGIGLAICKKAVQKLGGRIWVESEVDKGAIFYFTIPAH
jgi:PAS domain S-box-containing protein